MDIRFRFPPRFHVDVVGQVLKIRHFYGNACLYCFKENALKKCSACKTVSYCCVQHQTTDWPVHKAECKAIRTTNQIFIEKELSFEEFQEYKKHILLRLMENMPNAFPRSIELSSFPWVCAYCFSRENLNFPCENCKSVVYCNAEHRKQDRKVHKDHCYNLKMVKIFDSIYFENGYKFELPLFHDVMPEHLKIVPSDMKALYKVLRIKSTYRKEIDKFIDFCFFSKTYTTGWTVLHALQKINWLVNRVYKEKQLLTDDEKSARIHERMSGLMGNIFNYMVRDIDLKHSFIIHVVDVTHLDEHYWERTAFHFTEWISNIDSVELIFCGASLTGPVIPWTQEKNPLFFLQSHRDEYKNIAKRVEKPDIIILPNYTGVNSEFTQSTNGKYLFEYRNVPVIITSPIKSELNNLVDMLKEVEGVKTLLNVYENPFKDQKPQRIWKEKNISTFYKHQFLTALIKN